MYILYIFAYVKEFWCPAQLSYIKKFQNKLIHQDYVSYLNTMSLTTRSRSPWTLEVYAYSLYKCNESTFFGHIIIKGEWILKLIGTNYSCVLVTCYVLKPCWMLIEHLNLNIVTDVYVWCKIAVWIIWHECSSFQDELSAAGTVLLAVKSWLQFGYKYLTYCLFVRSLMCNNTLK